MVKSKPSKNLKDKFLKFSPKKNEIKRLIVNFVFVLSLGIVGKFMDNSNWTLCLFIVLSLVMLCTEIFYGVKTSQFDIAYKSIYREQEIYEDILSETSVFVSNTSEKMNIGAKSIRDHASISDETFNLKMQYCSICDSIYRVLKKVSTGKKEVSVIYVALEEDGLNSNIRTIGYSGNPSYAPRNMNVLRNIHDEDCYFDAKLFKSDLRAIKVISGSENIDMVLTIKDKEKNSARFSEFVCIPVICDSQKMIGLLQVFVREGTYLKPDITELQDFSNRYLEHFAQMFLLATKVRKALYVSPKQEKEQNDN